MYIASSQPHFDDVMRQLKELKELAGTAVTAYDAVVTAYDASHQINYQDHSPTLTCYSLIKNNHPYFLVSFYGVTCGDTS